MEDFIDIGSMALFCLGLAGLVMLIASKTDS